MKKTINNCEIGNHKYESRIKKVLERKCTYLSMGNYDKITLEQEEHYLFCVNCGDIKRLNT